MPQKNIKKEAELPSFLLELNADSKDISFLPKGINSKQYSGPLFFGQCHQFHPPLHSFNFTSFRHIQKAYQAKENIRDLFLGKTKEIKKHLSRRKVFKSAIKRKNIYSDPYTHRAPGTRKAFVPEFGSPKIDLGETTSIIEGETALEIPLYRLKKGTSSTTETEFELVMLSDIKEKERISMPYKERISHIHFPKQFAKVAVIGPTIPAAITVTKLPSKRKTEFEMSLLIKSKDEMSSKEEDEKKELTQVIIETDSEVISTNEEGTVKRRGYDSNEENFGANETEEASGHQEFNSEMNLTEEVEEETTETREEKIAEEIEETDAEKEFLLNGEKEDSRETNIAEELNLQEETDENIETDNAEEFHPQEEDKENEKSDSAAEKGEEIPNEEPED